MINLDAVLVGSILTVVGSVAIVAVLAVRLWRKVMTHETGQRSENGAGDA